MARFEIPLTPAQQQRFSISLGGVTYLMRTTWCDAAQCWILDISTSQGVPLIQGIPMVPGVDMLGQYEYVGIGGMLTCETDNDAAAVPTFANLGVNSHLYFETA